MISEEDLRVLVRDDAHDPGMERPTERLAEVLASGRRSLHTRRVVAGVAGVVSVGVVAVGVPAVISGTDQANDGASDTAAAVSYDPEQMPSRIDDAIRSHSKGAPTFNDQKVEALDSNASPLPRSQWGEAKAWSANYRWNSKHTLVVTSGHFVEEAATDPDTFCENMPTQSCSVESLPSGATAATTVTPVFYDDEEKVWFNAVTENPHGAEVFLERTEQVWTGTSDLVTYVTERTLAPSDQNRGPADWFVGPADLRGIGMDARLQFPAQGESQ